MFIVIILTILIVIEVIFNRLSGRIYFKSKLLSMFPDSIIGVTIGNQLFFKYEVEYVTKVTLVHEYIHIQQYKKFSIPGFLLIYLFNWIYNMIIYRNFTEAYKNLFFEREAYSLQENLLKKTKQDIINLICL